MTVEEELIELRQQNSLLREQVEQIPVLQDFIIQLSEQVKQLQAQLAKDSHNSSLPPSSDHFTRQNKSRSLRPRSGKKAGGQSGHLSHSWLLVELAQTRLARVFGFGSYFAGPPSASLLLGNLTSTLRQK